MAETNPHPKILIVDDEPEICRLLSDALGDCELDIHTAVSGRDALRLAERMRPDLLITDLCLGDCSGLDVIDRLRDQFADLPTVVITGYGNSRNFSEAARRDPLELMTKPLDLDHLRSTVYRQLDRPGGRSATVEARSTCSALTAEYRELSRRVLTYQTLIRYQAEVISCRNDDEVFRVFFKTYVRESGPIFGAALVCDSEAELRIAGRFGVPKPDSLNFCRALSDPLTELLLTNPVVQEIDAMDEPDIFDDSIRRYLPGLSILAIPLIPSPGEMIGMMMIYRKGEQPFDEDDVSLAKMLSYPSALAVRRND